jgi:ammonia channel protein AmtB
VAFIHPILVAWIWSSGWLYEKGFKDYSGSGVVFLIGGVSAFWGSWICGQRLGWADSKKQ